MHWHSAFAALCLVTAALANPVRDAHVEVELFSVSDSIKPGATNYFALSMTIDPGWHTYWMNPGDNGKEPTLDWQLPEGLAASAVEWPTPTRIVASGLVSYGYEGETLLLIPIVASPDLPAGTVLSPKARVRWLACKEACVGGRADLQFDVTVSEKAEPTAGRAGSVAVAREQLPRPSTDWRMDARFEDSHIVLDVRPPPGFVDEVTGIYFFPDQMEVIDHAADQTWRQENGVITLRLTPSPYASLPPKRLRGVLKFNESVRSGVSADIEIRQQ